MSSTTRTFIAVAVPDIFATKLGRLQQQLGGELTGVRWSRTPPFHVTLTFLGDVDNADLVQICAAATEVAGTCAPFELALEGIGVFPEVARPRVLWTGIAAAALTPLKLLHENLSAATARLGYPADTQRFHPHVTLGRFAPERKGERNEEATYVLKSLISHYQTWHAGPFRVCEIVVYSSVSTRDGPAYAPLSRASLRGRKPEAAT